MPGRLLIAAALLGWAQLAAAGPPYRPFARSPEVVAYVEAEARGLAATRDRARRAARFNAFVEELKAREAALGAATTDAERWADTSLAYAVGALELISPITRTRAACRATKERIILNFDPRAVATDGVRAREPLLPGSVDAVLEVLAALCRR
jgi:hypothetical protein